MPRKEKEEGRGQTETTEGPNRPRPVVLQGPLQVSTLRSRLPPRGYVPSSTAIHCVTHHTTADVTGGGTESFIQKTRS